ncbi:MAG: DNA alkylation repair protein [Candidatus Cloacimonetes bacterium]|jgi:3-methyladenine DNA glycosylase AlkD|nr:DNA alkylation repair protein [Candidatus Cloacimonadota bacterium]MBT6993997.1 DNA alkylation repair protein [Candidatus Cloacimonadota bacterium]MBT7470325.1 DNA alkylation repair protein [Candidatus Cloacimonadota bacterium]
MHKYVEEIKVLFEQNADAEIAIPMAKYMKNKFLFLGIKTPVRAELLKKYHQENGYPPINEIETICRELWKLPEREYQYLADGLLNRFASKMDENAIDFFEYLIITKSWWDTVDLLATKIVGNHFVRFPHLIELYIKKWLKSDNMWLQRTAILFQLKYKDKTDVMLLGSIIMRLNGSKEFFINKAIGWALREYSKTDAEAVINFVKYNKLASLSSREALKWLNRRMFDNEQ